VRWNAAACHVFCNGTASGDDKVADAHPRRIFRERILHACHQWNAEQPCYGPSDQGRSNHVSVNDVRAESPRDPP
jgi:hypothetical protein